MIQTLEWCKYNYNVAHEDTYIHVCIYMYLQYMYNVHVSLYFTLLLLNGHTHTCITTCIHTCMYCTCLDVYLYHPWSFCGSDNIMLFMHMYVHVRTCTCTCRLSRFGRAHNSQPDRNSRTRGGSTCIELRICHEAVSGILREGKVNCWTIYYWTGLTTILLWRQYCTGVS